MSNATVSSSGKTQSGTLHSLGGNGFDDYYANLAALYAGEPEAVDEVITEFQNVLRPANAGFAAASAALNHGFPQNHEPRQGAGSPPGNVTLCPTHQQQATWREPGTSKATNKPYNGFWKCPVTNESISNFNGNGLKSACPASTR